MSKTIRDDRALALQGRRAGFVSRVTADAIDFGVVQVIFLSILVGVATVRFLIERKNFHVGSPALGVTVVVQWTILVLYLGSGWSTTGRTIGKTVLGLRVGSRDGRVLSTPRAFLRAVGCASFYPSLLWIFWSRSNAALHDILLRTQVVYDWRGGAGHATDSHYESESPR
jgi:uncharacterized RDD family membrane protein YckC